MTKKSESRATPANDSKTRESLDELYMAHQVHTLAQLAFQQLAASGRWAQTAPQSSGGMTPRPIFYWYP